jgi:hypothetical protein
VRLQRILLGGRRKRRYGLPEKSAISPDELIKALKQYLQESGETERTIASRIGINLHNLHRWLSDKQSCSDALQVDCCDRSGEVLQGLTRRPPSYVIPLPVRATLAGRMSSPGTRRRHGWPGADNRAAPWQKAQFFVITAVALGSNNSSRRAA